MADSLEAAIDEEFLGAQLGDPRRAARLLRLARSMSENPDASFPEALSEADLEAGYRFFGNCKVRHEAILKPHVDQTVQRIGQNVVCLVVHDSSTLSYGSAEGCRENLSDSSGDRQHFVTHCSLAVTADGCRRPLGVLANSIHVAEKNTNGAFQDRWQGNVLDVYALGLSPAQAIHIMDREGDDFDVIDQIAVANGRFVVRMKHNRKLANGEHVRDVLKNVQTDIERMVVISRRKGHAGPKQRRVHPARDERLAKLSIGACSIEIPRPKGAQSRSQKLRINVVYVWEPNPPGKEEPIAWILYTSEPIGTTEQMLQVVDWYRDRWIIEEYFKALKSGCAIEKRQLGDLHSLSNALALFIPIAWRVLLLRNESRDRPDAPASEILQTDELDVLRLIARKPLAADPTIRQAVHAIAALGGHLKHNGEPGWQTIARGYEKLRSTVEGWRLRLSVERENFQNFQINL